MICIQKVLRYNLQFFLHHPCILLAVYLHGIFREFGLFFRFIIRSGSADFEKELSIQETTKTLETRGTWQRGLANTPSFPFSKVFN